MAHYLVTGGAGFIGSNLAHALVAKGEEERILDNFATGREENIAQLVEKKKVELVRGSITDGETIARAMRGIDYVLHQAAIPSVPRSIEDPLGGDDVNVHGAVTVLDGARKAGVKRVVFAASSSAYGEKTPGQPKVETMQPAPLSPYAAAKLAAEYYLQAFYHSYW